MEEAEEVKRDPHGSWDLQAGESFVVAGVWNREAWRVRERLDRWGGGRVGLYTGTNDSVAQRQCEVCLNRISQWKVLPSCQTGQRLTHLRQYERALSEARRVNIPEGLEREGGLCVANIVRMRC